MTLITILFLIPIICAGGFLLLQSLVDLEWAKHPLEIEKHKQKLVVSTIILLVSFWVIALMFGIVPEFLALSIVPISMVVYRVWFDERD